jgi:hypothetical protein
LSLPLLSEVSGNDHEERLVATAEEKDKNVTHANKKMITKLP